MSEKVMWYEFEPVIMMPPDSIFRISDGIWPRQEQEQPHD